jgi:hypothetical protein
MPLQAITNPMAWHACQTWQTCTARQRQQQGFHLIVCMLRQGNVLRALQIWVLVNRLTQGQVAGSSGCIFGTLSSFVSGVHFAHHQGHLPLLTQGAAMCFKQIGCILQTMVNVHSPHLPRPALNAGPQQSS